MIKSVSSQEFVEQLGQEMVNFCANKENKISLHYRLTDVTSLDDNMNLDDKMKNLDVMICLERERTLSLSPFELMPEHIDHQIYVYPDTSNLQEKVKAAFNYVYPDGAGSHKGITMSGGHHFDISFYKSKEQYLDHTSEINHHKKNNCNLF